MIVPFGPGGNADVFARIIAQNLSERLGEQFYIENVSGAGGNIGVGRAALAAPDGYTILVTPPSYVINPTLYDKIPYDARKSFDPVTLAVSTTVVLAIHPSVCQTRCPDSRLLPWLARRRAPATAFCTPPLARAACRP